MCVRAGPGLCLGPVSPSVPGPGPGYHTLIPPTLTKLKTASETVKWYNNQRGPETESVRLSQWTMSKWRKSAVIRGLVLCKKVVFLTAAWAGHIPSIVIISTFVIFIQDQDLVFNLVDLRKWIDCIDFYDGLGWSNGLSCSCFVFVHDDYCLLLFLPPYAVGKC